MRWTSIAVVLRRKDVVYVSRAFLVTKSGASLKEYNGIVKALCSLYVFHAVSIWTFWDYTGKRLDGFRVKEVVCHLQNLPLYFNNTNIRNIRNIQKLRYPLVCCSGTKTMGLGCIRFTQLSNKEIKTTFL